MDNTMHCPSCEGGTLTLCTGTVLSAPVWAQPYSTDGRLSRKATVESFVTCDACEYGKRTADVLKGRV